MSAILAMPKLGLTMTEGSIQEWKKSEGDSVEKGEIVLVVATEKLTYEIAAPESGLLIKILVSVGKSVPVGTTLGVIGESGEKFEITETGQDIGVSEKTERISGKKPGSEPGIEPGTAAKSESGNPKSLQVSGNGHKQIVVIGGGPGGYVAAIRAAQLDGDVTLIEKDRLGGTCVNVGCIPTKTLLHASRVLETIRQGSEIGIVAGAPRVDWKEIQKHKDQAVSQLSQGIQALLAANGVKILKGEASFVDDRTLSVDSGRGSTKIQADVFIIAAGSEAVSPLIPGIANSGVINSTEALSLPKIPSSMLILGGGAIGVEFASFYSTFGCKVTIIEMLPSILPGADPDASSMIRRIMESRGVSIHTDSLIESIEKKDSSLLVRVNLPGETKTIEAEKVLVAAGRRPFTKHLNLESAGIRNEKGRILVDEYQRTNKRHIFAVGDCSTPFMLAHVAMREGIVAAENILGESRKMDYLSTPGCVYTFPELAWVGLTEDQARQSGHNVRTGIFPLIGNAKSLILGETRGMVKIVADDRYGEILGVHIVGPRATDLIMEGAIALTLEATLDEITRTIHPHPTISEAMAEAAHVWLGMPIHIPPAADK